jgi:hypothetical protein
MLMLRLMIDGRTNDVWFQYGELTYAELSSVNNQPMMQQKPMYTCATLGRPRHSEFKRAEPTIYAQVSLMVFLEFPLSNRITSGYMYVTRK